MPPTHTNIHDYKSAVDGSGGEGGIFAIVYVHACKWSAV